MRCLARRVPCLLPPGVSVEAHISPGRLAQLSPFALCGQLVESDAHTQRAGVRLRRAPGRVQGRGWGGVRGQDAHGGQGAAADSLAAADEACRLRGSGRPGLQREFEEACRTPQDEAAGAAGGGGMLKESPGAWDEAEERTADECLWLTGGQKRWRAGASQIDGKDAGAVTLEREGKRGKMDADAPGGTGSRGAHETDGGSEHVQPSGEECEAYTMYSTLCPSDCGDEDLDGEEGAMGSRMAGDRCEYDENECSFDIFESFWSRVALAPTTAPAVDAVCACGVKEAPLARGGAAKENTSQEYPKTMDDAASEQVVAVVPRLAPIVWEKGLLPDEAEPQAKARHGPADALAPQKANRKVGRLTWFRPWAPSDGQTQGFEWVGDAARRETATSWTWLLRENEVVMEALVLGQRVLRLLCADPGLFTVVARGRFRCALFAPPSGDE